MARLAAASAWCRGVNNRRRSDEVREFLATRRARLTPDQVGLPAGSRRRVPGYAPQRGRGARRSQRRVLRRLERGTWPAPQPAVLEALARALQLEQPSAPTCSTSPRPPRAPRPQPRRAASRQQGSVRPSIQSAAREQSQMSIALVSSPPGPLLNSRHPPPPSTSLIGSSPSRAKSGAGPVPRARVARLLTKLGALRPGVCQHSCTRSHRHDPHDHSLQGLVGELFPPTARSSGGL